MTGAPYRDRTRARQLGRLTASPREARAWWKDALSLARRAAAAIAEAPEASGLTPGAPLSDLRHVLARKPPFPIEGVTGDLAVAAFLNLAEGQANALTPGRRALFAPALSAAALLLDGLLHEADLEAAQTWKRRLAPSERD